MTLVTFENQVPLNELQSCIKYSVVKVAPAVYAAPTLCHFVK